MAPRNGHVFWLPCSLKARGSKLVLLRGKPAEVLPAAMAEWGVTKLCFEADTEPYALERDAAMKAAAEAAGIEVASPVGHTLYDSAELIKRHKGTAPLTYKAFEKLLKVQRPPHSACRRLLGLSSCIVAHKTRSALVLGGVPRS